MTLFGADISEPASASVLRSAGCTFEVPRAVMETRGVDPNYAGEAAAAIAAGLIPGGYHWLMPQDGADQAALFLRTVRPYMDPVHGFVVWLDCEASSVNPDTGRPYHPDPTWADAAAWIAAFRAIEPDWPIGLYGNVPFLTSRAFGVPAGALAALHNVYLVVAAYPSRPPTLAHPGDAYPGDAALEWSATVGGLRPSMWQYVGTTHLAGQSVDLSAFRGDLAALRTLAGGRMFSLKFASAAPVIATGTVTTTAASTALVYPDGRVVQQPLGTKFTPFALGTVTPPIPGGAPGADRSTVLVVPDAQGVVAFLLPLGTDWPAGQTSLYHASDLKALEDKISAARSALA